MTNRDEDLLAAFPVALKHHLREERGDRGIDLKDLIPHLTTWYSVSKRAQHLPLETIAEHSAFQILPSDLTATNTASFGNCPVEITYHLASYFDYLKHEKAMDIQSFGQSVAQMNLMTDVLSTCERILRTRNARLEMTIIPAKTHSCSCCIQHCDLAGKPWPVGLIYDLMSESWYGALCYFYHFNCKPLLAGYPFPQRLS